MQDIAAEGSDKLSASLAGVPGDHDEAESDEEAHRMLLRRKVDATESGDEHLEEDREEVPDEHPAQPPQPTPEEAAGVPPGPADADEKICRICFDGEDEELGRLFSPCLCKGTVSSSRLVPPGSAS